MNKVTRKEVLEKLRRRYKSAGAEHKGKLLDQAVQRSAEFLGFLYVPLRSLRLCFVGVLDRDRGRTVETPPRAGVGEGLSTV